MPSRFSRRSVWPSTLRWALVMLPVVTCAVLVRSNATDVRFFDDWMMAETLVKYKQGTLGWGDIFAVQMEHRLAVPRLVALGLHLAFGKDMRWESAMTFLLICGMLAGMIWLLRRVTGLQRLRAWWLPAMLLGATLFTTAQWQTLTWPICFTSILPGFCLTLAMVCWFSRLRLPLAVAGAFFFAVIGTFSFATALLIWPLMLLLIVFGREGMEWRTRWRCAAAWMALMAVTLCAYFHHFENAVAPEFAYNQGKQVTSIHSMWFFVEHRGSVFGFVLAFLGGHLARGWNVPNLPLAIFFGAAQLLLFAIAVACLLIFRRRDIGAWRKSLPWLVFATHGTVTAVMVCMGRMWVTQSMAQALTVRYCAYSLYLTAGLVGLGAAASAGVLAPRGVRVMRTLSRSRAGVIAAVLFLGLQLPVWVYGARLMGEWKGARVAGAARLLFLDRFSSSAYLAPLASNGSNVAVMARQLHAVGMLSPEPLRSLVIGEDLRANKQELGPEHAAFRRLWLDRGSQQLKCAGYAMLPGSHRAADAVLLAVRDESGKKWKICGFVPVEGAMSFMRNCQERDMEFITGFKWTARTIGPWAEDVIVLEMPRPGQEITAWALDAESRRVYRIGNDQRPLPGAAQPEVEPYPRIK